MTRSDRIVQERIEQFFWEVGQAFREQLAPWQQGGTCVVERAELVGTSHCRSPSLLKSLAGELRVLAWKPVWGGVSSGRE